MEITGIRLRAGVGSTVCGPAELWKPPLPEGVEAGQECSWPKAELGGSRSIHGWSSRAEIYALPVLYRCYSCCKYWHPAMLLNPKPETLINATAVRVAIGATAVCGLRPTRRPDFSMPSPSII